MCASVKPVMSQLGTRRQTNGRSCGRCISPQSGQFSHTNYSLEIARHSSESARYPMPAHDPKDLPVPPPEVQKSPANRRAGPAHSAPRAARWLSRSTAPIAFDRRGSGGTRGARGRRSGRLDTRAAARLTEAGTRGRSGNGGDRRTRPRTPRAMAARTARPALGVGALEESAAAGAARYEVRLRDTRPRAAMRVARTRPRRVPARAGGGKRRASGARARVAAPDLAAARPTADANPAPPPTSQSLSALNPAHLKVRPARRSPERDDEARDPRALRGTRAPSPPRASARSPSIILPAPIRPLRAQSLIGQEVVITLEDASTRRGTVYNVDPVNFCVALLKVRAPPRRGPSGPRAFDRRDDVRKTAAVGGSRRLERAESHFDVSKSLFGGDRFDIRSRGRTIGHRPRGRTKTLRAARPPRSDARATDAPHPPARPRRPRPDPSTRSPARRSSRAREVRPRPDEPPNPANNFSTSHFTTRPKPTEECSR